eukprot:202350_1
MAEDPQEIAKCAYIAYVKEYHHPPQKPTQLVKFSKYHKPPFPGLKFVIARHVMANPPIIQASIGASASSQEITSPEEKQNAQQEKKRKKAALKHTAKPKTLETEVNAQQKVNRNQMSDIAAKFAALSTQNTNNDSPSVNIHAKTEQERTKKKSRIQELSQMLLGIPLHQKKPRKAPQPFQSGDPNAKPVKTVFQALSELKDIGEDEKYELLEQTQNATFVQIEDTRQIKQKMDTYLQETMKIKNKINLKCPEEITSTHSYHDDRYGEGVRITPISADPVLSVRLDFKFNEWDSKRQHEFTTDLAKELNIDPSQLVLMSMQNGSVELAIQICNIIKDKFPLIEKKCVTLINKAKNKISSKWRLKSSKLKKWASKKLGSTKQNTQQIEMMTSANANPGAPPMNTKLDIAEKWLLNQAEALRKQIVESLQDCSMEFEISGICILDNDKCLNNFIQNDDWKRSKLLFHGTKLAHLSGIYKNGFDDKFIGSLTDPGWYGRGHYFSSYPQYCMSYSEANVHGQRTLFVSYVNLGKTHEVHDMNTFYGKPLKNGFQSHYVQVSENGKPAMDDCSGDIYDEYVVCTGKRVLPRFCVTFTKKENVVVWRDAKLGNAENSGIMDKLRKSNVIYGALTTDDALKVITKKKAKNKVYVITNGADDSEGFIKKIRNDLNVQNKVLVFTSSLQYERRYKQFTDVTVTVSTADVYGFVNECVGTNAVVLGYDDIKPQSIQPHIKQTNDEKQSVDVNDGPFDEIETMIKLTTQQYPKQCSNEYELNNPLKLICLQNEIQDPAIVICLDSAAILIGFSGEDAPRIAMPNIIEYTADNQMPIKAKAMECGNVVDWNALEAMLKKALSTVDKSAGLRILITECCWQTNQQRELLTQMIFEKIGLEHHVNFFVAPRAVLSLYASGRTTGLVVYLDYHCIEIVPIYNGYCVPTATMKVNIGKRDILQYMKKFMGILVDETYNEVDMLFNPSIMCKLDDNGHTLVDGIHQLIFAAVMKCDVNIRRDMYRNIVLSGMNSMYDGIEFRLMAELVKIAPQGTSIKVIAPPERCISAWIGGSILGYLPGFQEMWVSQEEYDETGPSIVNTKCTRYI